MSKKLKKLWRRKFRKLGGQERLDNLIFHNLSVKYPDCKIVASLGEHVLKILLESFLIASLSGNLLRENYKKAP